MKRNGFTLIELVVVIAIIIILSTSAIVAYYRFTQRQAAMNDARSFSTMLRKVQSMAKNLVYPQNCTGLSGYRLFSDDYGFECETCQTMSAEAICSEGPIEVISDEKILKTAFFTYPVSINFTAGSGSINPEAVGTYILSNSVDFARQIVVTCDENGVISIAEVEITPTP